MKLKELRRKRNLTQEEVSKAVGITRFTYLNYESEKTQPDFNTLIKLADYFHVTVDNLIGHEVPYLLDKSTLTTKQKGIAELLPNMSDTICDKAEAYISGLIDGEKEKNSNIQRFKN